MDCDTPFTKNLGEHLVYEIGCTYIGLLSTRVIDRRTQRGIAVCYSQCALAVSVRNVILICYCKRLVLSVIICRVVNIEAYIVIAVDVQRS